MQVSSTQHTPQVQRRSHAMRLKVGKASRRPVVAVIAGTVVGMGYCHLENTTMLGWRLAVAICLSL